MARLFGTDGVRGLANRDLTADLALGLAQSAAVVLTSGRYADARRAEGRRPVGVVARDPRISGEFLTAAVSAGLASSGIDVLDAGVIPTPAAAFLVADIHADFGVMISASHNAAPDNGIKFFGPDGFKLSDAAELEIEELVDGEIIPAKPENIGRAKRIDDALGRYQEYAKTTFPAGLRLDGLKVVIDCANGAAYTAAQQVLWELGAEVIPVGVSPNGKNINDRCGSTYTQTAAEAVVAHGAHVGIITAVLQHLLCGLHIGFALLVAGVAASSSGHVCVFA